MTIPLAVIDANVLVAALLKDGDTRKLILGESRPQLITPDYVHIEFQKYAKEFAQRLHTNEAAIVEAIHSMIAAAPIKVIPKAEYQKLMEKAIKISPDPKDAPYFALAMHFECMIWSNDKRLKQQEHVQIYNTQEMIYLFSH